MTLYYVSDRGNNSNNGLSAALPKLTLTAVEALVAAGDTVHVQGGSTFRETLTSGINGSSGNIISFLNDTSGKIFGDQGGYSRITGSDNDQTITRSNAIRSIHDFRTYRGFMCDSTSSWCISLDGSTSTNNTIEDCEIWGSGSYAFVGQSTLTNLIIRRCRIWSNYSQDAVYINGSGTVNALVENCIIHGARGNNCLNLNSGDGITIRNCFLTGGAYGIQRNAGGSHIVENCLIRAVEIGVSTGTAATVTSRFNGFDGCGTNMSANVTDSGNNKTYPIMFSPFVRMGQGIWAPTLPYSPIGGYINIAGGTAPTEDWTGAPRSQGTNLDWGPVESRARLSPAVGGGVTLTGKGFVDFELPVLAGATRTVTATVSWTDNANIGTKPRLEIFDADGTSVGTWDASGSGSVEDLVGSATNSAGIDRLYTVRVYNRTTYTTNNNLTITVTITVA